MGFGKSSSHGSNSNLQLLHEGEGLNYRMKTVDKEGGKKAVSLWHDVTLVHVDPATNKPTPYLNFVCEIPKFSRYVYKSFAVLFFISSFMILMESFFSFVERSLRLQLMRLETQSSKMRKREFFVNLRRVIYFSTMAVFQ